MTEVPVEIKIAKIILDYVSTWKPEQEEITEDDCKWLYLNEVRLHVTVNSIIQCLERGKK